MPLPSKIKFKRKTISEILLNLKLHIIYSFSQIHNISIEYQTIQRIVVVKSEIILDPILNSYLIKDSLYFVNNLMSERPAEECHRSRKI